MSRGAEPLRLADYDAFERTKFFTSLDGLRCVSILAVIWQHTGGQFGGPWTNTLLGRGYMGVELFFVISGFLITTLLLRERSANGQISLKNFYARRTLRIFPLYYAALVLYVVMVFVHERHSEAGQQFFYNLRYFATYTSNMFVDLRPDRAGGMRAIFIFSWSLATEEQFYMVWPWAVRFLRGLWPLVLIAAIVAMDQSLRFGGFSNWIASDGRLFKVLTSASTAICLGVLTAFCLHWRVGFEAARRIIGYRWSSGAAALLVIGMLAIPQTDGVAWWKLAAQAAMALLVGACVIRQDHVLAPLLSWRPARAIGAVSYGMYMLHMFAIHGGDVVLSRLNLMYPICRFTISAVGAFGLALISYRFYESYFLRQKRRWSSVPESAVTVREQERAMTNWATGRDISLAPVGDAGLLAAESRA
jgi:peptidoglycan/LPS O-acetylase OafA/YrhL